MRERTEDSRGEAEIMTYRSSRGQVPRRMGRREEEEQERMRG